MLLEVYLANARVPNCHIAFFMNYLKYFYININVIFPPLWICCRLVSYLNTRSGTSCIYHSIKWISIFNVAISDTYLNHGDRLFPGAVVRVGTGGTFVPPEFRVSERRTEREIDSLLLSAPPDLKNGRQLWILYKANQKVMNWRLSFG